MCSHKDLHPWHGRLIIVFPGNVFLNCKRHVIFGGYLTPNFFYERVFVFYCKKYQTRNSNYFRHEFLKFNP